MNNASFAAIGENYLIITLEAESSIKGSWGGVFISANYFNNVWKYITIKHANGEILNSTGDRGNVVVYANGRRTMKSRITH